MSSLKEIAESRVTVSITPKKGLIEQSLNSLITFSLLGLCIYISQGSSWWTFFTGILMIVLLYFRVIIYVKKSNTTFNDKNSAIEYLQGLD